MCDATSDEEARSVLYIQHFSEPCPQCTLAIGNGVFPCFSQAQTGNSSTNGSMKESTYS